MKKIRCIERLKILIRFFYIKIDVGASPFLTILNMYLQIKV